MCRNVRQHGVSEPLVWLNAGTEILYLLSILEIGNFFEGIADVVQQNIIEGKDR